MAGAGGLGHRLFPATCLLCGAPGHRDLDLCPPCLRDLPRNLNACPRCALPLTVSGELCGHCQLNPPAFRDTRTPFRYAEPLTQILLRFKFGGELPAGRLLGRLTAMLVPAPENCDCLVPIPLHRARLRSRGFNQAMELARVLGRHWGLAVRPALLGRLRPTREQTRLDAAGREANLRGAFRARRAAAGLRIMLVDDVLTTGATAGQAAAALYGAGAARVSLVTVARAVAGNPAASPGATRGDINPVPADQEERPD